VNVKDRLRFALLCLALSQLVVGISAAQTSAHSQSPAQPAFTDKTASGLLLQLSETLEAHSLKRFMALFDVSQMKNGGVFRQQVTLFFSQTDSIRVYLSLVETAVENERATLNVDAEMDAQPNNGPAWRRNAQLTLVLASAGGSWKIVDIQPRSFFSLP
jgi:hypothetical protein